MGEHILSWMTFFPVIGAAPPSKATRGPSRESSTDLPGRLGDVTVTITWRDSLKRLHRNVTRPTRRQLGRCLGSPRAQHCGRLAVCLPGIRTGGGASRRVPHAGRWGGKARRLGTVRGGMG